MLFFLLFDWNNRFRIIPDDLPYKSTFLYPPTLMNPLEISLQSIWVNSFEIEVFDIPKKSIKSVG